MSNSEISYEPKGLTGFAAGVYLPEGSQIEIEGSLDDVEPTVTGSDKLVSNRALVENLWAYGEHECQRRRTRNRERADSHKKAAALHGDMAVTIAIFAGANQKGRRQDWCSACFTRTEHRGVDIPRLVPDAYLCSNCGAPTSPCVAPRCSNMADRGIGSARVPRYCAEHRHDVRGFKKLSAEISSLDAVDDWLAFEKHNLAATTRITVMSTAAAAVIAPAAFFAAPAIAGALGASALGGSLTGAAAVSHGLAMLGGGSLAAGGLGMAGGTAVIVATGAAVGGSLGAVTTSAYVRDDKSFRIQRLREGVGTPVLLASGFLTEGDDGWGGWERMVNERYPKAPIYRVFWGSKELRAFGGIAASGLGKTLAAQVLKIGAKGATKKGSAAVPYFGTLLIAQEVIANPWSVAVRRAGMTASVLADILGRTDEESFVLIGHSLGARVMVTTAGILATRPGGPKLETVHLLGAAVASKQDWRPLNDAVRGKVWNYHSSRDTVLTKVYRTVQLGQHAAGVDGMRTSLARISNVDLSKTVGSHSAYFDVAVLK